MPPPTSARLLLTLLLLTVRGVLVPVSIPPPRAPAPASPFWTQTRFKVTGAIVLISKMRSPTPHLADLVDRVAVEVEQVALDHEPAVRPDLGDVEVAGAGAPAPGVRLKRLLLLGVRRIVSTAPLSPFVQPSASATGLFAIAELIASRSEQSVSFTLVSALMLTSICAADAGPQASRNAHVAAAAVAPSLPFPFKSTPPVSGLAEASLPRWR